MTSTEAGFPGGTFTAVAPPQAAPSRVSSVRAALPETSRFGNIDSYPNDTEQAAAHNFGLVVSHVMRLYASGSSSVPAYEARELSRSVAYALRQCAASESGCVARLAAEEPLSLYCECLAVLEEKLGQVETLWDRIISLMPPIRNIALRDTLASIGRVRRCYDCRFAAHEVPCDIQYPLSEPVGDDVLGLDYLMAWLVQLHKETKWTAQFEAESCIRVLEAVCPDYKGLHVNLYDLLEPHVTDLRRARKNAAEPVSAYPHDAAQVATSA